jgi:hypothetical protein
MQNTFQSEIEGFLTETGMNPYRFGILAAKNGRLVERVRTGGRFLSDTEAKVRAFMADERKRLVNQGGAESSDGGSRESLTNG